MYTNHMYIRVRLNQRANYKTIQLYTCKDSGDRTKKMLRIGKPNRCNTSTEFSLKHSNFLIPIKIFLSVKFIFYLSPKL